MSYAAFNEKYRIIIRKALSHLRLGHFAVFVVGEIRDKKTGSYKGFVSDTVRAFTDAGAAFYNDIVLVMPYGTAMLRAKLFFGSKQKIVKVHQNVLVFRKV